MTVRVTTGGGGVCPLVQVRPKLLPCTVYEFVICVYVVGGSGYNVIKCILFLLYVGKTYCWRH